MVRTLHFPKWIIIVLLLIPTLVDVCPDAVRRGLGPAAPDEVSNAKNASIESHLKSVPPKLPRHRGHLLDDQTAEPAPSCPTLCEFLRVIELARGNKADAGIITILRSPLLAAHELLRKGVGNAAQRRVR